MYIHKLLFLDHIFFLFLYSALYSIPLCGPMVQCMVARLTPDHQAGCSNHSGVNIFISYYRDVKISGSFIGDMSKFEDNIFLQKYLLYYF